MWTSQEDARRYQGLTQALQGMASNPTLVQAERQVEPEHLALYLEWFELAREAAPSVRPFLDKCSPYVLRNFSYRQMATDFRWLVQQTLPATGNFEL